MPVNLPEGTKRFKARGALDEGGTKQGAGTSVEFRVYTENPGPLQASAVAGASHEPAESTEQLDVHPELTVQLFASEPMMLSCTKSSPGLSRPFAAHWARRAEVPVPQGDRSMAFSP